ncbi:unnamed protein product [Oikopleura dioica]|uniref:Uncharacterized protein n=1 Tax=Oikopleura dioica TaxID=34765 RepID=E4XNY2_OIKDI|nr:unnamed protein product [Oikopleura dioica]
MRVEILTSWPDLASSSRISILPRRCALLAALRCLLVGFLSGMDSTRTTRKCETATRLGYIK